jgi:uncharacterized delta-60 repeat protein
MKVWLYWLQVVIVGQVAFGGLLDSSFNIGTGANGLVEQVLQIPHGKILVCGNFTTFNGKDRGYIALLNNDGSVDESFNARPGYWVRHMTVQPDGKIVIGGYFKAVEGVSRNLIARLNPDGSLDTSFDPGSGAQVLIAGGIDGNIDPFVFWTEVQPDGKILATGNFRNYNGESSMGIVRINPDGSRDTSFDVGGGLDSWGRVIKVLPNGQILLGGWFTSYHGQNRNRLVRINSDGTPDSNFNPFYGDKTAVYSIALRPDGKVITSGDSINPDGLFRQNVVVLNDDGSVDQSWAGRTNDKTESLLLQDDGKLILTGYFTLLDDVRRPNIGRLNADGTLDDSFSVSVDNFIWTVTPAGTGKILVSGGFFNVDGESRNGVARLNLPEGATPGIPAPRIFGIRRTQSTVEMSVNTILDRSYTLQYCNSTVERNWVSLPSVTGNGGSITLTDPSPQTPRFYRVAVQ